MTLDVVRHSALVRFVAIAFMLATNSASGGTAQAPCARAAWHQTWVTNRGELLLLDGGMKDEAMVLTARGPAVHGVAPLLRGVWRRQTDGSVRETAERSTDGGGHWDPVFDLVFRRPASLRQTP